MAQVAGQREDRPRLLPVSASSSFSTQAGGSFKGQPLGAFPLNFSNWMIRSFHIHLPSHAPRFPVSLFGGSFGISYRRLSAFPAWTA